MEKQYFGYIRVSTAKQGEKGVSLIEQKSAIERYAQRYQLTISQWYEERESAAKHGRPIFSQMLKLLRRGKAQGIVIHKIDRGARNLKDWADLGELIDAGTEVHFANESLDLNTRGGRLSADIQAVVSSDYIRNLREETKKGFYGRLKQGLYPLPAPIGYVDRGKGKPKEPDPIAAPLVTQAFQLYSTGHYSLHRLLEELLARGIRNKRGQRLSLTGLSTLLNNPFYAGLVRIKRTDELFPGIHQPLIGKSVFDRVQRILKGKTVDRVVRHEFIFRRMVQCGNCRYSLIGERQKGHVYYRCHTTTCDIKTIREEQVDSTVASVLTSLRIDDDEMTIINDWFERTQSHQTDLCAQEIQNCRLQIEQIRDRLSRLTDAYVDAVLDKQAFEERRKGLVSDEATLKERLAVLEGGNWDGLKRLQKFLELVKSAPDAYQQANIEEKRDLVKKLTSNLRAVEKNVAVTLKMAAQIIANRHEMMYGAPYRGVPRTWDHVLKKILSELQNQAEATT